MAFAIRDLSVLAYANGFTLWHYKTSKDTVVDVREPGFFDDAEDMIATGDHIHVSATDGGAMLSFTVDSERLKGYSVTTRSML